MAKGMDKNNQQVGKTASLIILWGLLVIVFFRPLISGITWEWSNTYAQILLLFLLAVWLLRMTIRGELIFQRTALDIPILLFSLSLIISLFGSVNKEVSFRQLYQFLSYPVLYFLIINNTRAKLTCRRGKDITVYSLLLPVMLIAVVLVSFYGIYQHYWGLERTRQAVQMLDIQFPPAFMARLWTHQVFSTFVFPPALAGYLVILLPLAITLFIFARGRWPRVLPGLALAAGVLCLYFTYSKGGWGVFILSLAFLAFILVGRRQRRWVLLSSFIVIGLFLILVLSGRIPYVDLEGFIASFGVRVDYWRAGLRMLRDYPLFGSGLGTFGSLYAMYKLPGAEETQFAHNNYLQVWTETGILGIISFLWLWGAFLRAGWKTIKDEGRGRGEGKRRGLVVGCYVGVIAFLIHSLVDFGLYVPGIATYVWLFMGMVLVARPSSKLYPYTLAGTGGRGQVRSYKLTTSCARIVMAIAIVSATVFLMITVRKPLTAERYFQESSVYLRQGAVEEAIEYLNKAIRVNPRKGAYYFRLGSIYQNKGLLDEAISQYRKAIERNPFMPHYRSTLGKALWDKARGQDKRLMEEAVWQFEKARDLFPARAKYQVLLGRIYELKGRGEEALEQYKKALELDPSLEEVRARIERLESR